MRGTILGYDPVALEGVITSLDGNRIAFMRSEWKSPGQPTPGRAVDYEVQDGRAAAIYIVPAGGASLSLESQDPVKQSHIYGGVALGSAIISFFLGPIGIITLGLAIFFGLKGKRIGETLADRTGYYMSIGALILSAIAFVLVLLGVVAVIGLISLASVAAVL